MEFLVILWLRAGFPADLQRSDWISSFAMGLGRNLREIVRPDSFPQQVTNEHPLRDQYSTCIMPGRLPTKDDFPSSITLSIIHRKLPAKLSSRIRASSGTTDVSSARLATRHECFDPPARPRRYQRLLYNPGPTTLPARNHLCFRPGTKTASLRSRRLSLGR